jgi:hypothetical protein
MYAVAFDVELDRLVPHDRDDWTPKITCAATYSFAGGTKLYFSLESGRYCRHMTRKDVERLLDDLYDHKSKGALIISWGGCAVDFRAIYSSLHSGDLVRQFKCLELVKSHVDVPIASATDMGVMMGLEAASKGMGLSSKSSQSSCDAPEHWRLGHYDQVLKHVENDAMVTLRVYTQIMNNNPPCLFWMSKSGKKKQWFCSWIFDGRQIRLLTVGEALERNVPHTHFPILPGMDRRNAVKWFHS